MTGEAYLVHCVETAIELAEGGLEAHVVAAAILHGCLDDSMMTEQQLSKIFGSDVVELVVGVSSPAALSSFNPKPLCGLWIVSSPVIFVTLQQQ